LYFNSSLEGISPPQWQGFICSRIYFCQAINLHHENRIFHPSGRASSVQESTSVKSSLSTMKIGFFHPSGRASTVEESTSVKLSLSTKKIGFFHPSGKASSVQETASINLLLIF